MKTYTKYILSCVAVTTMALAINSAHNTSVKTADLKDPSSFSFNAKSNDFAMHQPGTGTVTKVAFDGAGIRSKFGNSIDFGSSDSFPLNQKFDGFFAFQPGFGTLTTMWFASHSTQDKFSKAADFNDLNTFPPDTKFDNFSEFKFGFGTFLFVNEKGKLVKRFFRGEFANFFCPVGWQLFGQVSRGNPAERCSKPIQGPGENPSYQPGHKNRHQKH